MAPSATFSQFAQDATHDIPLEVLESTMQCIEDRQDLCAASRVSRFWHSAALPSLFRTIDLSNDEDVRTFTEITKRTPAIATSCVKRVRFQPGTRAFSTICANLVATGHTGPDHLPTAAMLQGLPALAYKGTPNINFSLPSVTALDWASSFLNSVNVNSTVTRYLSVFPSLTSLTLTGMFPDVGHVLKFIGHCGSRLEYLDLSEIHVGYSFLPGGAAQTEHVDLINLRKLVVHDTRTPGDWIFDIMLSKSPPSALREFSVEGDQTFTIKTISRLLDMSAASLQHFKVDPFRNQEQDFSLTPMSQNLVALRSFTMGEIQLGSQFKPFMTLKWLKSFISSMADLPTVELITLAFYAEIPGDLLEILDKELFDWDDFFNKLLPTKFSGLKKVMFNVGMETDFGRTMKTTLEFLARQILPTEMKVDVVFDWEDLNPRLSQENDPEDALLGNLEEWLGEELDGDEDYDEWTDDD